MRIKSLSVKNNFLGWELEEMHFTSNLTLLVGGSGVGKTQILRAINNLKSVVEGKSINGFEWKVSFVIDSGKEYLWKGEFEVIQENKRPFNVQEEGNLDFTLLRENLTNITDKEIIIKRNPQLILYQDVTVNLKLDSTKSLLFILKEEERINELTEAFSKINLNDNTERTDNSLIITEGFLEALKKRYGNLERIKNSHLPIQNKLLLCSELKLDIFDLIARRFMAIFPQIESLEIKRTDVDLFGTTDLMKYLLFIKEKGVSKWINEEHISSGMLRTILHIAELYLSNDGSVILIDEFENSLGINCIDILTDDLIHENKSLQFIATSHHPYIINNIPYEYWKIVSRKGGKIQVRNAAAYKLGKSKQAAFIQLTKMIEKQAAAI